MSRQNEIRKLLKPILWDYDIDPYDLFLVAVGKRAMVAGFAREKALKRIFERLSWYDLIRVFGLETLKDLLRPEIVETLEPEMLRDKYEFARKTLHGEAVSLTGWDPAYREKVRHTLLSNRWYSTGQGIFRA
jgi:hypothetical protein